MPAVALKPQLMEQLEQVASEQSVLPEQLAEAAVRTYLCQIEREKIQAEVDAFEAMHADLVETYLGQYVAIHDGQVIDHDRDFQAIHSRIRKRFGSSPVLLRRVKDSPKRILTFRSPHFKSARS